MKKTLWLATVPLLALLFFTACSGSSDSSSNELGGIQIPSFFKSLSDEDKKDFSTSMEQVSSLFQNSNISSDVFNQALSDIRQYGFADTAGAGLKKSDLNDYQRQVASSLSDCSFRSRTIDDANVSSKTRWVEDKTSKDLCSAVFSGAERSASSIVDGARVQTLASDMGLTLSQKEAKFEDKDFVNMATSLAHNKTSRSANPGDALQRSETESEYLFKVTLETKDGVKTNLEMSQKARSKSQKLDDRGPMPSSSTETLLVFYGSQSPGAQNPVVYQRSESVSNQVTTITIKINGEVVFQQPKDN